MRSRIESAAKRFDASSKLLDAIMPADLPRVIAASQVLSFHPGEMIYRQGEPSLALAVLLEGEVKLSVPSAQGRELLISVVGRGQSFGEIGFFDGKPRSVDATAVAPSRVQLIGRVALLALMESTPALAMVFVAAMCRRLRLTTSAVRQAVFYSVEARLADCLLRLADGRVARVWQHELAAMTGVTRESVNKQLRIWRAAGLIESGRGWVRVLGSTDLAALAPEIGR